MIRFKTISETDFKDHVLVTDSVDEALNHLKIQAVEKFKLLKNKKYKPSKFLGEFWN
jgi:hypothetical protein